MPIITGLSRAGFLPSFGLKSLSCLFRYSGNWPAIFGFAGAVLLPSAAWHAAHTCAAMLCPRASPGFTGGCCASAEPAQQAAKPAPSARRRIIARGPDGRGPILLEF